MQITTPKTNGHCAGLRDLGPRCISHRFLGRRRLDCCIGLISGIALCGTRLPKMLKTTSIARINNGQRDDTDTRHERKKTELLHLVVRVLLGNHCPIFTSRLGVIKKPRGDMSHGIRTRNNKAAQASKAHIHKQ